MCKFKRKMGKTFNEVWAEKIERANTENVTRFVFGYELNYFVTEWVKTKWTEPVPVKLY